MIKKIVLSLITVLSFCSLALAQNKQVTGTVTDEKGEPIIGATVVAEVRLPVRRPEETGSLH